MTRSYNFLHRMHNRNNEYINLPSRGPHTITEPSLYHSYQDCPIDFHIRQSVPFHDHDIVPPTISWPVR